MTLSTLPRFNLEGFTHLVFSYDAEDDIAYLHIDGPRASVSTEVDDAWYLRLADDEIVGLELHGLKRMFLSTPFFASVFKPAIAELQQVTGKRFFDGADEDIHAEGSIDELPQTTHLVILMIGQAVAKYEALQKAQYATAGRNVLAHP